MRQFIAKTLDLVYSKTTGKAAFHRRYRGLDVVRKQTCVNPDYEIVYILPPKSHQGWILDAICREIDVYFPGRSISVSVDDILPSARAYFYSHYSYFRQVLLRQPNVLRSKNVLFYTHPRELWFSNEELVFTLKQADSVLSMCSMFANDLRNNGVDNVVVGPIGADPLLFQPHSRGTKTVGFCSGYVPRKDGAKILQIVQQMPNVEFKLCGPRWHQWDRFGELLQMPNFSHCELTYAEYPAFYRTLDVFVSVSTLEGGPVPLVESMLCNIVPVASRTGHAPDIITHCNNGFLFDVDATVSEVCGLIDMALCFDGEIRSSVEHLTWERFSHQVQELAGLRSPSSHNADVMAQVELG